MKINEPLPGLWGPFELGSEQLAPSVTFTVLLLLSAKIL